MSLVGPINEKTPAERKSRRVTPPAVFETTVESLPTSGNAISVLVSELPVALFNAGDRYFAISDFCLRCGGSLALGVLRGQAVSCIYCDWTYDLTSGRVTELPALRTDWFEVRLAGSKLTLARQPSEPPGSMGSTLVA